MAKTQLVQVPAGVDQQYLPVNGGTKHQRKLKRVRTSMGAIDWSHGDAATK